MTYFIRSTLSTSSSTTTTPAAGLRRLIDLGRDRLPLPGHGQTLARWQALADVAAEDLPLVKLFEGHTDALAICHELGAEAPPPGSAWGTWCAEPPDARVTLRTRADGQVTLHGRKSWCSGADAVTHAVVSGWNADGAPCLAAVAMAQPGVTVTDVGWDAVGMAATRSVDVIFDGAVATAIGQPGDYVKRPGFWHGGAGIAACWFGGASTLARLTREGMGSAPDAHRQAHLGAIDVAMTAAAALLRESAAWIDQHPEADAQAVAMRARLVVEHAATEVMHHASRALGAGALCRNARFARTFADLPVFLRQSHAERDLAALGLLTASAEGAPWTL